ncbi:MAG: hypothetical protein CMP89_07250 [Gammaproteobacteria bacterium]|nr:hypothetical protein [Gammaproteobacteria bacterium]
MKYIKHAILAMTTIAASSSIFADDHSSSAPTPIPVEFYSCTYNAGKGPSDLQPVIKEWKKAMGKREYQSWMLHPIYASDASMNNSVMFTGWWPSYSQMGKEVDYMMDKVSPKLNPLWAEVITCDIHAETMAMQLRDGMDMDLDSGVMTYQQCNLKEGKSAADLMQANAKMGGFMTKAGVSDVSAAVIFPGTGAPDGFDYVMTFWAPSMTVLGETFEKAMASGIGQVQRELFADLTECSNGTRYSGSRIY